MVRGCPAAVLLLCILMIEQILAFYVDALGPSSRRVLRTDKAYVSLGPSSLYILIANLRESYVSRFGLSSHRVSTAHIDDGRAKGRPK